MLKVSVILPCYHAASVAMDSIARLREALDANFSAWEIIVVDDGGHDMRAPAGFEHENFRLIRFEANRGKGAAVRAGMLAATGDVRIYTDVDLPYGTAVIPIMAQYIVDRGFHVVIGDRTMPGSIYREQLKWPRRLASWVFSAFVGRLVTGGFFDTQCGLKAFRGDIAEPLFSQLCIERFASDVEVLYVCLKHRLDIKRIPVLLENNVTSSVRLLRDSLQGIVDILRIKHYQLAGRYRILDLERVVQEDHTRFVETREPSAGLTE